MSTTWNSNGAATGRTTPGGPTGPGNNPFLPVVFPSSPPAGPMVWEDGPGFYVDRTGAKIMYNGQTQTATINTANPKPPAEDGPGPAVGYSTIT